MRLRKNWFRTASRRTVRGCRRANPDNSSVALPPRLDAGQLIAWWRRLPSGGRFHLYLPACTGPHRDGPLPATNVAAPGELGQRSRAASREKRDTSLRNMCPQKTGVDANDHGKCVCQKFRHLRRASSLVTDPRSLSAAAGTRGEPGLDQAIRCERLSQRLRRRQSGKSDAGHQRILPFGPNPV